MSFASRDGFVQELTYLHSQVYMQGSKKKKTRLGLVDFLARQVTDQLRFWKTAHLPLFFPKWEVSVNVGLREG